MPCPRIYALVSSAISVGRSSRFALAETNWPHVTARSACLVEVKRLSGLIRSITLRLEAHHVER
jgi:hypothetical protein